MQSEILNAKDPLLADNKIEETTNMILQGAKRELKFCQAAMIDHQITTTDDKSYLETTIDVFARGKTFVLGACSVSLLIVFIAIYQSNDNWPDRLEQLLPIALVIAFILPVAFVYLNIEKRIRHYRLHKKIEVKLKELIIVKTGQPES